jgi:hypothetical protein
MQLCLFYTLPQNGVKRALDVQAVEAEPKTVSGGCWHHQVGRFDPFLGGKRQFGYDRGF